MGVEKIGLGFDQINNEVKLLPAGKIPVYDIFDQVKKIQQHFAVEEISRAELAVEKADCRNHKMSAEEELKKMRDWYFNGVSHETANSQENETLKQVLRTKLMDDFLGLLRVKVSKKI
jgi:hypothetical protein